MGFKWWSLILETFVVGNWGVVDNNNNNNVFKKLNQIKKNSNLRLD